MLRAWLRSHFPAGTDLDDIIQDAYIRVLRVIVGRDQHEGPAE